MRNNFFAARAKSYILPTWKWWAIINVCTVAVLQYPLTQDERQRQFRKRITMGKWLYTLWHLDDPEPEVKAEWKWVSISISVWCHHHSPPITTIESYVRMCRHWSDDALGLWWLIDKYESNSRSHIRWLKAFALSFIMITTEAHHHLMINALHPKLKVYFLSTYLNS